MRTADGRPRIDTGMISDEVGHRGGSTVQDRQVTGLRQETNGAQNIYREKVKSGQASFQVVDVMTEDQATTIFEPQFDVASESVTIGKTLDQVHATAHI